MTLVPGLSWFTKNRKGNLIVSFYTNVCGSIAQQSNFFSCSRRNINYSSFQVRAAVVDAHYNIFSIVKIDDFDAGTERKGSVGGGEMAEMK